MIFDSLSELDRYRGLSKNLDNAIDYLLRSDLKTLETGRNEISGDDLFAMRMDYTTILPQEGFFESHKKYIDIQILLNGEETIRYGIPGSATALQPYDEEGDCQLFKISKGIGLKLQPGYFALFFPDELHAPKLSKHPENVEKVVLKIKA